MWHNCEVCHGVCYVCLVCVSVLVGLGCLVYIDVCVRCDAHDCTAVCVRRINLWCEICSCMVLIRCQVGKSEECFRCID